MVSIKVRCEPLDISLNNGRDYVQGSQMVACLVDKMALSGCEGWRVSRASFHKITNRMVFAVPSAGILDLSLHIGQISFSDGTERIDFSLAEAQEKAPSRVIAGAELLASVSFAANVNRFVYKTGSGFWPLLDTIVQACKLHVLTSAPGAIGFMFTSLGANTLPLLPGENWSSGRISIEELRRLDRRGVVQTMNRFVIDADNDLRCEGIFGFAFRVEVQ